MIKDLLNSVSSLSELDFNALDETERKTLLGNMDILLGVIAAFMSVMQDKSTNDEAKIILLKELQAALVETIRGSGVPCYEEEAEEN